MKTENKQLLTSKECKEIQLKILEQVANICDENNLIYCICGGTLLGAVRHKGFIPWDDDIDICMPRKDYSQLISILKNQTQCDWLSVIDGTEQLETKYYLPFAKAVNNKTITKQLGNNMEYGVFIDIFPLDKLPQQKIRRKLLMYKFILLRAIILSMTTDFTTEKYSYKLYLKKLLNMFSKIVGKDNIYKYYKKEIKKCSKINGSEYVGNTFPRYGQKEILKEKLIFKTKKYTFENRKFYGPEDYDTYLSNFYGEYMKLPPEDKREDPHNIVAWKI